MSDEPVTKTIVGQCEEISEKNGWTTFSVNVGTQYPVRLSTKLDAIVQAGRAVGQDVATWTFKESQGKENPNKPGTHFVNRYLDKVDPGGNIQDAGTASGTPLPEAHHEQIAPADKDRAISRMAFLKAASWIYGGKGDPNAVGATNEEGLLVGDKAVLAVLEAADRMERHVYRDIDDVPF